MYVIVVGAGKIGFYLTRALLSANHEVTLIDRDAHVSEVATEEFGSIVITSDGTEPAVLYDAGAARCDIFISTTGSDATNLVACQVAKYSFNAPKTMAVVTDPDHVPLFRQLRVDVTISTTDLILSHVQEELAGGPFVHVLPLKSATNGIVVVRVPRGSPVEGMNLSQINLPSGTLIAAVIGRNGVQPPTSNPELNVDDEIVAITPPEQEQQLWRALTGGL